MNHYFTPDGLYSYSQPEGRGRMPRNARRIPLPAEPWTAVWPRWNGKAWELVEDHRERDGAHAQEGTPYWLENDTADTPPRFMATVGALPDGALPTRPTTSADENKEGERV